MIPDRPPARPPIRPTRRSLLAAALAPWLTAAPNRALAGGTTAAEAGRSAAPSASLTIGITRTFSAASSALAPSVTSVAAAGSAGFGLPSASLFDGQTAVRTAPVAGAFGLIQVETI